MRTLQAGLAERYALETFLLCTVRPGLQAHTRICEEVDFLLVGSTGFAVLRPQLAADSSFICHAIFGESVAAQLRALETGSNYPAVNERDVRGVSIFWPVKEQRRAIAAVMDTLNEAIAKTEAVIAKLRQVRAGLLHDLLTRGLDANGRHRVPLLIPSSFKNPRSAASHTNGSLSLCGNLLTLSPMVLPIRCQ
jgi:type I restriction enzyme S subunit